MSIKLVTVKCPECGATLDIEENRKYAYCSYCGTKILIHNENEHIYRHIDEAGIKQAETERIVKIKQIELAEKTRAANEKNQAHYRRIAVTMWIVGTLFMIVGYLGGYASGDPDSGIYMLFMVGMILFGSAFPVISKAKNEEETDYGDKVRIPVSINNFEEKNYATIEAVLTGAGFTNVRSVPLNDLKVGILKKPLLVESITVNGQEIAGGGKKYPKDAAILITYHSFSGGR